jgi:hypothetical protein
VQPAQSDNLVSLHANFISHVKAKERKLREWTTNGNGFRLPMPGEDRKNAAAALAEVSRKVTVGNSLA